MYQRSTRHEDIYHKDGLRIILIWEMFTFDDGTVSKYLSAMEVLMDGHFVNRLNFTGGRGNV